MLSFQTVNEGESIMVYCDSDGLEYLINTLVKLKSAPEIDHVHMLAPSAGGIVLNDQNPWGEKAASEVIVSLGSMGAA